MSRFIAAVVALVISACAHSAQTVLVVGDSLSAGYGMRRDEAWPALAAARIAAQGLDWQVANASISGDTTASGRSRLAAALARHRPALVVIALGANDALRGLPIDAMRDNLRAMIREARAARARVLLVGMDMPPNYGEAFRQQFRATFAGLAATERVPLVPFLLEGFATRRELFQADGIHPAAAAQPLILDNVWPALKPLLSRGRRAPAGMARRPPSPR
ncbi:MAG: arylesterase [Rhodocyclales bacterium CG17_big_fil_post_rev_8_21_14_2_50_68_7]|nr:MAG: arylesterase [Betaproteobacteria bacterium CG2_30_68_42]PIV71964.1 MAG: arylesterase [Rhodocyclales bacterium CG17_big_fil_post_rev_8_21_14_2_50_68_7]PJA57977.1 MAG: arylesterase [Rhodocyclales bacterium CG_4_9_14_3_um_filter_68_10]